MCPLMHFIYVSTEHHWTVEFSMSGEGGGGTHLFHFEDVLVEVLLELLVGIVDAELLKGVLQKHLKTKYVKHSNRVSLWRRKIGL